RDGKQGGVQNTPLRAPRKKDLAEAEIPASKPSVKAAEEDDLFTAKVSKAAASKPAVELEIQDDFNVEPQTYAEPVLAG
ncbi:hypothetical protein PL75_11490, partial [Neisseria arctica]